jgi:hypothetical protein
MTEDDYYRQTKNGMGDVDQAEHGDGPMRTRSEATQDGARIEMSGRPPQNEDGVRGVCVRLAQAISVRTGEVCIADPEKPLGPEDGVDWYLKSKRGDVWGVQVTRVGSRSRWAQSARGERVAEEIPTPDAASEIWEAIERKLSFRGGILALDIGQPGLHGFRATLEAFREKYGRDVQEQVRFTEVWLVGYSPETTLRVHPW